MSLVLCILLLQWIYYHESSAEQLFQLLDASRPRLRIEDFGDHRFIYSVLLTRSEIGPFWMLHIVRSSPVYIQSERSTQLKFQALDPATYVNRPFQLVLIIHSRLGRRNALEVSQLGLVSTTYEAGN